MSGAIGLVGVGILVLALRPVALFLGEERWVQVDGTCGCSYSVNDGLRGIVGHWAYSTVVAVTVPARESDAAVRGRLASVRVPICAQPGSGMDGVSAVRRVALKQLGSMMTVK